MKPSHNHQKFLCVLVNSSASLQSTAELNHPTKVGLHNPPSSSQSKATRELNLTKGSNGCEVISGDKTLEPYYSEKCQVCFIMYGDIILGTLFGIIMTILRLD